MDEKKLFLASSSVAIPALSLIGGAATAFFIRPDRFPGTNLEIFLFFLIFLLLSVGFFYFTLLKNHLIAGTVIIVGLFFTTGYLLTYYELQQFDKQSERLSSASIGEGRISRIDRYPRIDRIQVKILPKNLLEPSHHFILLLPDKEHTLTPGMKIQIPSPLRKIEKENSPFRFDPFSYWKYQHTSHEVFIYKNENIRTTNPSSSSFFYRMQQALIAKTDQRYPTAEQAGLIKALLLGDRSGISAENKSYFKNAGLLHILAVSGLHVGIITLILHLLLYPVRYFITDSKMPWILMIGFIWIYAAVTGLNIPVIRASVLATFFIFSKIMNRKGTSWNIYFWAVLLVLIADPFSLFTVSFQLSFGAVASILIFYEPVRRKIIKIIGEHYLTNLAAVSIAAQICLIPLLIFHFNEISIIGLISSVLVIPLLLPVILCAFLSLILPPDIFLTKGINLVTGFLIDLIHTISEFLGNWSFSNQIVVWHPITVLALCITIAGLALYVHQHTLPARKASSALITLSLLTAISCESYNIYIQRNKIAIAIHPGAELPVVDIYYKGFCYTNKIYTSIPEILKSRKKHYTTKTTDPFAEDHWKALIKKIEKETAYTTKDFVYISLPGRAKKQVLPVNEFYRTKHLQQKTNQKIQIQ